MTSGSPRASSLHPVCLSEPHHKSKCCSHTLISRLALDHSLYAGHDKPVSSVSWSLNRQWWLSASEDQSLRIWTLGSAEPAIILVKLPFLYKHTHLLLYFILFYGLNSFPITLILTITVSEPLLTLFSKSSL